MKLSIIIFVLVAIVQESFSQGAANLFRKSYMTCKIDYPKFSRDILTQFVKNNYETSDHSLMCFLNCIGHEMKNLDSSGVLQLDNILKHPPPLTTKSQILQKVEKCNKEFGANKCETAYKQIRCALKRHPI